MKEFFDILNNTSGERLFWYTMTIICILTAIGEVVKNFSNK